MAEGTRDVSAPRPALVLSRHGQTEWNAVGRRQGQLDSPLTPVGVITAERLAASLVGLGIDGIITSPLGRARQTAEVFAAVVNVEITVVDALREIDHGVMAGLSSEQIAARFPIEWGAREQDRCHWQFPGGESYEQGDRRAVRALATIARPGVQPATSGHARMIGRMLRRHLLGLSVAAALRLNHPQGTAYLIQDGYSQDLR